ncbi:MAG TPA: hypothetical protein VGK52_06495 [Polyangia bacterium]
MSTLLALAAGCGDNTPAFRPGPPRDASGSEPRLADGPSEGDGQPADGTPGGDADGGGLGGDAVDSADVLPGSDAPDAADTPGEARDAPLTSDGPGDVPPDALGETSADARGDSATVLDTAEALPRSNCAITRPTLSATHPALNGVPAAQGGDRASVPGAPYAVTFEVATDLVDGEPVALDVESNATPGVLTTFAAATAGGRAVFANVPLASGVTYEVTARCTDENGLTASSASRAFPVDIVPPDLVVSKPSAGDAIPPSGLTNGAFSVCGSTTSPDAVGLDAATSARAANYCVGVGGSPACAPVAATNSDVCIAVPCPGDAPFDITVSLSDRAGNPTTETLAGVSCFSTLPSVRIVAPVSDAPGFADVSKRLLAADSIQPLRDLDGAVAGAQTNVVACANRAGSIALFAGLAGDAALGSIAANVPTRAAAPADGCPAGFAFVAVFTNATLPESAEGADTSLATATVLRADLTDISATKNSSPLVDLWVDSVDPVLLLTDPPDICASMHQTSSVYISTETVTSTAPNVTLELRNDMSLQTFDSTTFTTMTFPFVVFAQGQTFLSGVARDGAGNASSMRPDPCVVTVAP